MIEYKIIESSNLSFIVSETNHSLNHDWQLAGPLTIGPLFQGSYRFYQPMTREVVEIPGDGT